MISRTLGYLLLLTITSLLISCQQPSLNFVTGNLDHALSVAKKKDKKLLVLTSGSDCELCSSLEKMLNTDERVKSKLSDDYLIYKCHLKQIGNEYLGQIAYSVASPTTYIFNADGSLSNIIVGSQNATFFLTELENPNNSSLEKHRLKKELTGKQFVSFLNILFNARRLNDNQAVKDTEIMEALDALRQSINSNSYFYNNYMAAKLSLKIKDKDQAKRYAENALRYNDAFSLFLYKDQRKDMKFIANSAYNATKEGFLQFENTTENIGTHPVYSAPKATFRFRNTGKVPLTILEVKGSCDCINIKWPAKPIMPDATGSVEVTYNGKAEGGFSKALFVRSNAVNDLEKLVITGVLN